MRNKQHRGGKIVGQARTGRQRKIKIGKHYVECDTVNYADGRYMGFYVTKEEGYKSCAVVAQFYAYRNKDKSIPKNIQLGPFVSFVEMEERVRAFMKQYNGFLARWQRSKQPYHTAVIKFLNEYKIATAELKFV